ncbi:ACT domain-containing protein [Novosphingobium sp. 1949]|uniref:ACT domain-containing protein n=1 Tax=Novosphingobium organovorum TaxID=2930092 RepID=A0ABT0BFM5_9SPHN|nr:ACT domain-containing protein [Novosphingobium organovorum]MCJ2183844.1 ACT domain-containing protein [Novosphingobium organovorum]
MPGEPGPVPERPIVREARAMVAGMAPRLDDERYVFVTGAPLLADAIAMFREAEGLSQIVPLEAARSAGLDTALPMVRIVLEVHSALDGYGLTAAVAGALADARIACNMVAAFHHDHAFVPAADAARALAILQALQTQAQG